METLNVKTQEDINPYKNQYKVQSILCTFGAESDFRDGSVSEKPIGSPEIVECTNETEVNLLIKEIAQYNKHQETLAIEQGKNKYIGKRLYTY